MKSFPFQIRPTGSRALAPIMALLPALLLPLGAGPGPAAVYNIKLLTDSSPDLTDLDSYLHSITSQFPTPQEKAISIWRWSQRLRKQTSNPQENGQYILDPILLFNNYGHCNCGIVSGLNNTFWLNMGWDARYVQLGDHTVSETSWDDGATWHMFDSSMSFYCFNDEGSVASVTEIERNPRFYLENFAPECGTNPVKGPHDHQGWRSASDRPVHYKRTLANGYDSFKAPNSLGDSALHTQWGQRFVLNLRPDESYTRHFGRLDEEEKSGRLHRPLKNGKDPEDQHGHRGLRANGSWRYAPDLRKPGAPEQVHASEAVIWGDPRPGFAVRAADPRKTGHIVLKVAAANVTSSARLSLNISRGTEDDTVAVEVSTTAGINWQPVWSCTATGTDMPEEIDLMKSAAGATEYLVRIQLSGPGAGLESIVLETITQINRASLPKLVRGKNRVQFSLGDQVETTQFMPSTVEGNHRDTVEAEHEIDVEKETGFYKPVLRPAENGTVAFATWKISTPTPITAVEYGGTVCVKSPKDRVTLLHSWDGGSFEPDYEKTDGSTPFDLMVVRPISSVPPDRRAVFLRYEFATETSRASYQGPGIQMARMTVHHKPRITGFTPVEITYCWTEHRTDGDVERQYTELAGSPAHEFNINVGGFRDPTMKWVRMNLQGSSPGQMEGGYGYSDGEDVGPGVPPERVNYHWGKNVALGKTYTLTGTQSDKNPDAGGDLTDGIIAPPDDYVSEKYMPTNVIFKEDSPVVAVVDLGSDQPIAAVRVHAGQEQGFQLAFPEEILVEGSLDGREFAPLGTAVHNQVFDPPANFQPWENENSPKYDGLPAGGRLAYAYRVIGKEPVTARYLRVTCIPRNGWGLLLSEIQAFEEVTIDRDVPPPVVLPALPKLETGTR